MFIYNHAFQLIKSMFVAHIRGFVAETFTRHNHAQRRAVFCMARTCTEEVCVRITHFSRTFPPEADPPLAEI